MSFSILQLDKEDRPREKLMQKGKKHLTNAELLAIIIGTGTRQHNALDLAHALLEKSQLRLDVLAGMSWRDLAKVKGVGQAKALMVLSALELSVRNQSTYISDIQSIQCSRDIHQFMFSKFSGLSQEEFWVIYLNRSNRILEVFHLSKGGIDSTIVDVRVLCKKAIENLACQVVLCHNHPSGNIVPSEADKISTHKIIQALKLIDVKLVDHLIIFEQQYFSFVDQGLIT